MSIKFEHTSIIDKRISLLARAAVKVFNFVRLSVFFLAMNKYIFAVLGSTMTLNKGFSQTYLHGYKAYAYMYN